MDVTVATPHGAVPAYLASPAGDGPWPGVVLVHDALGLTREIRAEADWLADAGYLALVPDLFSRGRRVVCLVAAFRDLRARRGRTFDTLDAGRAWLAGRVDCTGRTGVIGYCAGGGFALLLAAGHGFAVASVNYGQVPRDAETALRGACPVVGSFGGRDRTLRGAADRLDRALSALGVEHDVEEYPQAGHDFLTAGRDGQNALVTLVGRLAGAGYDESAARDTRRRVLSFFDRHLR